MKIAIDARLWHEGGVGRYIRNLVHYLLPLDQSHEYTLILPPHIKANVDCRVIYSTTRWHSLAEQTQFLRELKRGHYDLVHFPYFSHPFLYNRPFVITIHDLTILNFATGKATTRGYGLYLLKRLGYRAVLNHALNQSQQIIVPSQFVKNDLLKRFEIPEAKISVTYEGVGYELLDLKIKTVAAKRNYLLYIGNFYPHKNVEFLLKAFRKNQNQDLCLYLCGPNDFFARRLKELVSQLELADRVKFFHDAGESTLVALYKAAQALVLPSVAEGFGLAVVEAAYFGCPLLLADIPVFREIAPPSATFFNPNNEPDLLRKISLTQRKPMPDQQYFRRFSFAAMAKHTLAIYNRHS